jgi:hypothetical protein
MGRYSRAGTVGLSGLIVSGILLLPSTIQAPTKAQAAELACAPPTQALSSPEESAWRLFVAATCPVNHDRYPYVGWETWIEQTQLYQSPTVPLSLMTSREFPRFHRSPPAQFLEQERENKKKGGFQTLLLVLPNQGCGQAAGSTRTICEETRINADAASYITSKG